MELMRISTVPCHAGGTNTLPCRSSASKLYSFEASTQPAVVSPIFPRDSLRHHLRWYWYCIVRSSSNVEFFVGSRSTLERNWNLHISFCVQVMESHLQDFQQLQAGFTMFRTVFLCTAGVPRHRQMPLFFLHLYGFTCWHVRVSFGTRGLPGGRFERSRAGGKLDWGSIRGRCTCPKLKAMNFSWKKSP